MDNTWHLEEEEVQGVTKLFDKTWDLEVSPQVLEGGVEAASLVCPSSWEIPKMQLDRDTLSEQILRKLVFKIKEKKQCPSETDHSDILAE